MASINSLNSILGSANLSTSINTNSSGTWVTGTGTNIWGNPNSYGTSSAWVDPSYEYIIDYFVYFIMDEQYESLQNILTAYFKDIKKNKILFTTGIDNKKLEPLESIQKLIKLNVKFDMKIQRPSHTIVIKGVTLKGVTNILSREFNSTIKISFDYDDLVYDNTLMTIEEKRGKKVNELLKNIKKHDI